MLFKKMLRKVHAVMNTVVKATDGNFTNLSSTHVRTVYSKEIQFLALPIMKFLQFAKVKSELGTQPGLQIQIMTYANITKGGALTEGTRMTPQAMSASYKAITVGERGNSIAFSELAYKTSFTNLMQDATTLLARDMAIVLDCELRDVALASSNVIYGRLDKFASKINARGSIVADSNILSVATVKDAVEILATANAPKFSGQYYVCFCHPHQSRTLRDDPAWIDANRYGSVENLYTGEIGRIDDVRFIESTLMCNGAVASTDPAYVAGLENAGAGAIDVYQAVIFGEDFYGYAIGLPVEIRDNGVVDFGREHGIAWYSIWGTAILQDSRGVVIETC